MNAIESRNEKLAAHIIQNMKRHHIDAYYCPRTEDAINKVKELIPEESSISWGGSETIRQIGLTQALKEGNYKVLDRDEAKTIEERNHIYRQALDCDFFLTSANAVTEDGLLVNMDGLGNRIAAITWGPKHVIFVIGMNKVCHDLDAAISRVRHHAAPINAQRFDLKTPCHEDGICHDCHSPECICNYLQVVRNSFPAHRHQVILVGEELGF